MSKHYLIKGSLVSGLAVAAVAFPSAAQAMFLTGSAGGPVAPTRTHAAARPSAAASSPRPTTPVQAVSPESSSSGGFQWVDAGIGAGGSLILLGGAAAGAGVTPRRRIQRTVAG
jgi:hypothetical protein